MKSTSCIRFVVVRWLAMAAVLTLLRSPAPLVTLPPSIVLAADASNPITDVSINGGGDTATVAPGRELQR